LPRQFRDRLPARVGSSKRNVVPKPRSEVTYADVAAAAHRTGAAASAAAAVSRAAADLNFRAGAKTDLLQHPESNLCRPRGLARRLAEEAERRRARRARLRRTANRAAATAAAAAAAASPAPAPARAPAPGGAHLSEPSRVVPQPSDY
jgi:hypothetical protein